MRFCLSSLKAATKSIENNLMESEDLLDQKLFEIATTGGFDILARQALADYKTGKTVEI